MIENICNKICDINEYDKEFIVENFKFKICEFNKKSMSTSNKNLLPKFFLCGELGMVAKIRYYKTRADMDAKLIKFNNYITYATAIGMRCSIIPGHVTDKSGEKIRKYKVVVLMDVVDNGNSVDEALRGQKKEVDTVHVNLLKHGLNFDILLEELGFSCVDGQPRNFAMRSDMMVLIDEENLVQRRKLDFLDKFNTDISEMRNERGIGASYACLCEIEKIINL